MVMLFDNAVYSAAGSTGAIWRRRKRRGRAAGVGCSMSGSLSRFSDFALDLRCITNCQLLPGCRLTVDRWNGLSTSLCRAKRC